MITVDSTLFYIELNLKGSINKLDINIKYKDSQSGPHDAFETFTTVLLNNKNVTRKFFRFVNKEDRFEGEITSKTRGLKGLFLLFPDNSIELTVKYCNVKELKTVLETRKYYNVKEIKQLLIFLSSLAISPYRLGNKPYFVVVGGRGIMGRPASMYCFVNFLLAIKFNYISSPEDIVFGDINRDIENKVNNTYRFIISLYPHNEPIVFSLLVRYLGTEVLRKLRNDFPEKLNSANIIDLDKFRSFLNSAVAEALINKVTRTSLDMGLNSIDEHKELFSKSQANALIFIENSIPLYHEYATRLIDFMNEDNLVKLLLDTNLAELHELDIDLDSPAKIFCIK